MFGFIMFLDDQLKSTKKLKNNYLNKQNTGNILPLCLFILIDFFKEKQKTKVFFPQTTERIFLPRILERIFATTGLS